MFLTWSDLLISWPIIPKEKDGSETQTPQEERGKEGGKTFLGEVGDLEVSPESQSLKEGAIGKLKKPRVQP